MLAAKETIRQEKAGFLPTVAAAASYSNNGGNGIANSTAGKMGSIGVSASLPIYNGGSTLAQTRQARYNYVAASAAFDYTHRTQVAQTRQAYMNVLAQASQIKADAQSIRSAQNAYEATQAGFSAGTQTMQDTLNDLATLYQARQQYTNDQYQYIINIITLKQSAGTLQFKDLVDINSWLSRNINLPINNLALNKASMSSQKSSIKAHSNKKSSSLGKANHQTALNNYFTLQLMAAKSLSVAKDFMAQHPNGSLAVATHQLGNQTWYVVGYGHYNSAQAAQNELASLPDAFKNMRPWVTQVEIIH
jgi:hypothetical protein